MIDYIYLLVIDITLLLLSPTDCLLLLILVFLLKITVYCFCDDLYFRYNINCAFSNLLLMKWLDKEVSVSGSVSNPLVAWL